MDTLMTPAAAPYVSQRTLTHMLDAIDYGMLLVTPGEQIAFANQVARCEMDEQHPLQQWGGALRARRPQDVATLREALASALGKGLRRLIMLGDPASETVSVAVVPMGDPVAAGLQGVAGHSCAAAPSAMLVFGKRKVCEDLSADAFARQHRLTSAEARVLKQLCAGRAPTEIARSQGVALSTVRTQISCIREKTAQPSICALLRQVAKLPPLACLLRAAA